MVVDSDTFIAGCYDNRLRVFSFRTGTVRREHGIPTVTPRPQMLAQHTYDTQLTAIGSFDSRVVVALMDSTLVVVDPFTAAPLGTERTGFNELVALSDSITPAEGVCCAVPHVLTHPQRTAAFGPTVPPHTHTRRAHSACRLPIRRVAALLSVFGIAPQSRR